MPIQRAGEPNIGRPSVTMLGGVGRIIATGHAVAHAVLASAPRILLNALLEFGDRTKEGQLVEAVAVPWYEILAVLKRDPEAAYQIEPRRWEEIIAGAYDRAGFDDVVLTPRSGDHGRDVIATRHGVGSVRFIDQVKAYKPGHVVTAAEVREMLGTLSADAGATKAVITTTSTFAPELMADENLARFIPYRLELKPHDVLLPWLDELATRK